jgi:hypothetical protein
MGLEKDIKEFFTMLKSELDQDIEQDQYLERWSDVYISKMEEYVYYLRSKLNEHLNKKE